MIAPVNGRIVHFHKQGGDPIIRDDPGQPLAAMIVHVHNERMVNLVVFDSDGSPNQRQSIPLLQDGDASPERRSYCEWMPYQKGQAAKTEQLEQKLSGGTA